MSDIKRAAIDDAVLLPEGDQGPVYDQVCFHLALLQRRRLLPGALAHLDRAGEALQRTDGAADAAGGVGGGVAVGVGRDRQVGAAGAVTAPQAKRPVRRRD